MQWLHYTYHFKTKLGLVGNDIQKNFSPFNTYLFPIKIPAHCNGHYWLYQATGYTMAFERKAFSRIYEAKTKWSTSVKLQALEETSVFSSAQINYFS